MKKFYFTKTEKVSIIIMIIIICGLFVSSSMPYSQQKIPTHQVDQKFKFIEEISRNWNIYYGGIWHNRISDHGIAPFTQFLIRKFAHFSSFFLLGIFSFLSFKRLFVFSWTSPFFVWFYTIFWAVFDEFHQFITGDRTPSVHDVVLDSTGSLCGIILCGLIYYLVKKLKENHA